MSIEKTPEEQRQEAEQMQNVLLLLNHLIECEETTLKLIIDCLYEVGTVNLINQKVTAKQTNRLARQIAGLSKPAAKIFALRWFKKNCPALIVKWLHSKVSFKAVAPQQVVPSVADVTTSSQPVSSDSPASKPVVSSGAQLQEIRQLQGQVKILAGLLLCTMTALGGTAVWQMYQVSVEPSLAEPVLRPVTVSPDQPFR